MFISGHGKGYAYDMGSETDISIFIGVILLMLWLAAVIPIQIWSCRKLLNYKKAFMIIPIVIFIICFVIGVFLIGLDEFLKLFGLIY